MCISIILVHINKKYISLYIIRYNIILLFICSIIIYYYLRIFIYFYFILFLVLHIRYTYNCTNYICVKSYNALTIVWHLNLVKKIPFESINTLEFIYHYYIAYLFNVTICMYYFHIMFNLKTKNVIVYTVMIMCV